MDNSKFFDFVREHLFKGRLTQSQVDGLNNILSATQELPIPYKAYILATAYHETGHTMQPLDEYGKGHKYDYGRWKFNSKGDMYCFKDSARNSVYKKDECDHLFYGRGLVQLTWYSNYELATERLIAANVLEPEESLLEEPELANDPFVATWILKMGMLEGWFTGRKLSHYFDNGKKSYTAARRIINGRDKADLIASYAVLFEKALSL